MALLNGKTCSSSPYIVDESKIMIIEPTIIGDADEYFVPVSGSDIEIICKASDDLPAHNDEDTNVLNSISTLRAPPSKSTVIEKNFSCPQCQFSTHVKRNLQVHMRQHTDEKPFVCPHCSHGTRTQSALTMHMRVHSGERAHVCEQCPYAASTAGNLRRHQRRHTGERPYQCERCPYRGKTSTDLKTHTRTHTGERPYRCPADGCHYRGAISSNLLQHMRTHRGDDHMDFLEHSVGAPKL